MTNGSNDRCSTAIRCSTATPSRGSVKRIGPPSSQTGLPLGRTTSPFPESSAAVAPSAIAASARCHLCRSGSRASTEFAHTRWCRADSSNVNRGPMLWIEASFVCGAPRAAAVASSISNTDGVRSSASRRSSATTGPGASRSALPMLRRTAPLQPSGAAWPGRTTTLRPSPLAARGTSRGWCRLGGDDWAIGCATSTGGPRPRSRGFPRSRRTRWPWPTTVSGQTMGPGTHMTPAEGPEAQEIGRQCR